MKRVYPSGAENLSILRAASRECDPAVWENLVDTCVADDVQRAQLHREVVGLLTAVKDAAYAAGHRKGARQ